MPETREEQIARWEREGWRPIETAPRDGTEFLGYFHNGDMHVVWLRKEGTCVREMDDQAWSPPTHWRPLPNPPSSMSVVDEDRLTRRNADHLDDWRFR